MLACLIDDIRAGAHPVVAFSGFCESHEPPPLGDVLSTVPAHHDGHQNSQQSGYILHQYFVDCHPGGCPGDTERVVARWQRPVASDEALGVDVRFINILGDYWFMTRHKNDYCND